MDVNVGGMVTTFADDISICGMALSDEDYLQIQKDLDQLSQWLEE